MSTLAYYVHHIDPFVFQFWYIRPRWYGVAYLLGFLGAYLLLKRLAREGMLRLNPERVPDLVLNSCIFGVLVGGRLGFVLFYDLPISLEHGRTPLLWDFSSSLPFWGVLKVWDGGMSAHGGIVFTIITLWWFARKYRAQGGRLINIGDAACMVVPIGLFFGRCANFVNGELYGHPTTVAWAVKFPSEVYAPTNGKPTVPPDKLFTMQQSVAEYLRDHAQELTTPQVKAYLENDDQFRKQVMEQVGPIHLENAEQIANIKHAIAQTVLPFPPAIEPAILGAWWQSAAGHSGLTGVMEKGFDAILPPRHPSQLYEAGLEGLALFGICWTIGRTWRKDGMASGAFLTLYPVMRIIGEQFRVGDTPATIMGMEISKGVMYSLPMVVGGAIYWGYFIKRSKPLDWQPQGFPVEPEKQEPPPDKRP